MLAGHLEWDRPGEAELVRDFWGAPHLAAGPGLKAVEMFDAIGSGKIKAVWIMATNPAVSLPAGDAVRAALGKCDLVVVSDCVRESDTADFAHVRLPALAWGEKDGTVTNSERVISRQRRFLAAPGEARADWWAVAQVASLLGYGDAFAWQGPADIFREHAALTGQGSGRVFDISGLAGVSDAEYAAMEPTRWPVPATGPRAERLMGDRAARMVATPFRGAVNAVSPEWPLVLMTGRVRDQWHTMTRTGKTPRLLAHSPEPVISVHPDDGRGLADGGLAVVESAWGRAVLRVRHDAGLRPGRVFAPMHWTARFCPQGRVNSGVNPAVDPVSGQPELKHTPVRLMPFVARWHGFVLARASFGAEIADWTATWPARDGVWRHEVAGSDDPAAAFVGLQARCAVMPGGWIALQDAASGVYRAALVAEGRLQACVFVGPDHALPAREWLVGLFGLDALPMGIRRTLLAGRPAEGGTPDPYVCVCHGVGAGAIRRAIGAGCRDVEAVGRATRAGTNCGSCRPEIRGLLAALAETEPA